MSVSTKAFDKILSGRAELLIAYYIGRDSLQRDEWISKARQSRGEVRSVCIDHARHYNQAVVRQMKRLGRAIDSHRIAEMALLVSS